MIVVNLMGGLGNQMFQYAAGRALAHRHHTALYLDQAFLNRNPDGQWTPREFELDVFPVKSALKPGLTGCILQRIHGNRLARKFFSSTSGKGNWCHFSERSPGYDSAFMECPRHTFLHGYFQSEKYFEGIADLIRQDFSFPPAAARNAEVARDILNCPLSVSVHVRRGDYVTLKTAGAFHGTMETAYYEEGARRILSKLAGTPTFFLFSDDPNWVRENLQLPGEMRIIDWNQGKSGFEDMRLMSLCQHHIIANSSFSWWGAWLNPSPEKLVVAPDVWFRGSSDQPKNLLPDNWIRL